MADRPLNFDATDALPVIGSRLKDWRRLQSLTQADLARRAGLSVSTVQRLEAGDGGVSVEALMRVLAGLHIADLLPAALDPLTTELGLRRANEVLPQRVRKAR